MTYRVKSRFNGWVEVTREQYEAWVDNFKKGATAMTSAQKRAFLAENTQHAVTITVASKRHFDSLVDNFREGFMTVTRGERIAEFENGNEFVTILLVA